MVRVAFLLFSLNIQHIKLLISGSSFAVPVPVYCQNSVSGSSPHCHMQNTEGLKDVVYCYILYICFSVNVLVYLSLLGLY